MVAWTGLTEVNKKRLVHFLLTLKGCIFYLILQLPKSKWWMNISLKDNQTHQTLIHNEKKKISSMKWIHTITLNNTQNITTKYTNKLKFTAVIIHVCMVVYNRHFTAGDYCSTT